MTTTPFVWDEIFSDQEWGKYPAESLIRFIARNYYKAPNRSEISILELGCGPGANLWYLCREGFRFTGLDFSTVALERAKSRLTEEFPLAPLEDAFVHGSFTQLPFKDQTFDAVIDNEAVYCVDFNAALIAYQEAHRVLKPGGKMFSRTFAEGCMGNGTGIKLGYNFYLCDEGPTAAKGAARFTSASDIETLFASFHIESIELITETRYPAPGEVREWLITARK